MTKKQARRAKRMRCTKEFMPEDEKPLPAEVVSENFRTSFAKQMRMVRSNKKETEEPRVRIRYGEDLSVLDREVPSDTSKAEWLRKFREEVREAQSQNEVFKTTPDRKAS